MKTPLFCVDAFTDVPFRGNPAAVCLLERAATDYWMAAVAAEMNLSETAFVVAEGDGGFGLRWFTPRVEVDLCGHATLAAAHVLWEAGRVEPEAVIRFQTRSGELVCRRNDGWIEMAFPSLKCEVAVAPAGLIEALGVVPVEVCRSRFDWLVAVATQEEVVAARPEMRLLAAVPTRGVILTARSSDASFDFVSRFFGPAVGVDEDPVTGSAHCCLGVYWRRRLGCDSFIARQLSARGGTVRVRLEGDRAILGGQAVTVHRGELLTMP
jgi:PhzF family phenazine biosynthesis protein